MANQYTYKPPFTREELEARYLAGRTQQELAEDFQTTQKVIWRAMRKWGIAARKAIKRDQRGERNAFWKGDEAGYAALHIRVEVLRGKPERCDVCGTTDSAKHYDWANLTGNYADPSDYQRMCRSCHWEHDETYHNLGSYAQRKELGSDA